MRGDEIVESLWADICALFIHVKSLVNGIFKLQHGVDVLSKL